MARSFLQVPILTREDEKIIQKVAEALERTKADAARYLFRREYERIQAEAKRAAETPVAAGERACGG